MFLEDILFPKFCLGCGFIGSYICIDCASRFKVFDKSICFYCNKPSYLGLTHPLCIKRLNIDGSLSFFHYNNFLKKIIKNIKYRLATEVFDELALNIRPVQLERLFKFKNIIGKALIQPIPLTEKRFKMRGFNQAELFSSFINKVLGLKTADFLIKENDSFPQAQIENRKKRYKNIRGVFSIKPKVNVANKTVVLVDDVITTGATVCEAARVLKKSGSNKVYVISLARGLSML